MKLMVDQYTKLITKSSLKLLDLQLDHHCYPSYSVH
jgi:hypothetical protein